MTIETITEHGDPNPDPERDDPTRQAQGVTGQTTLADAALRAHATVTIKRLLQEHPAMAKEIRDTLRARVHLREMAERTNRAEKTEADTEQHESNLAVKLDPGDHRTLGFGLGLAIVVALVILDAVPLNWATRLRRSPRSARRRASRRGRPAGSSRRPPALYWHGPAARTAPARLPRRAPGPGLVSRTPGTAWPGSGTRSRPAAGAARPRTPAVSARR